MSRARAMAALALLVAGACARSEPIAVPPERVPFPLSRAAAPNQAERRFLEFRVALVRRGRIAYVARETFTRVGDAETAVRSLLTGPLPEERRVGIRTEIPLTTGFLGVSVVEGIATVDLTQEFQQAGSSISFLLRVAQVVYTLAALEDVVAVRFAVDGGFVNVPTDHGRPEAAPVGINDYDRFRPRARP